MKYIKAFIYETAVAYTVTVLIFAITKDNRSSSQLLQTFAFMACIISYQILLQFITERFDINYWNIKTVVSGYIGGLIVYFGVGTVFEFLTICLSNALIYVAIHTFILFLAYEKEVKEIEQINKQLSKK